jgi:prophage DNA circulation protein
MNSITLLHIEKYFPFIQQISEVLKTTFPDKLNTCYIYNAPYIFSKLFSVVSMFIDKKTQQKIQLVENE